MRNRSYRVKPHKNSELQVRHKLVSQHLPKEAIEHLHTGARSSISLLLHTQPLLSLVRTGKARPLVLAITPVHRIYLSISEPKCCGSQNTRVAKSDIVAV